MNIAAHHHAALFQRSQRLNDEWTHRREDDGGIKALRRKLIRIAGPERAQFARELLGLAVAGPREGVNLASLMPRHLRDDVSCGAESVNAQPFCVAGLHQRAIASQTGAKQRHSLGIGIKTRQWKTEPFVCQREFRVAPIQRIAGEAGLLTKVLATGTAKAAFATRPTQPRNTHARAGFKPFRPFATLDASPTISWPGTSGGFG